ncbi:MAG: ribonuclease HII [Muribaculaceae bacterium]|nr:ribonuclease HII [Muribaculaceae bacterium]
MTKEATFSLPPCLTAGVNEAGCDEAGRGCLAGPVYAAAVILPPDYRNPLLNDSKKLSEKRRNELRSDIEKNAVAWAIGVVTAAEIDRINILNASILAMHRALDSLSIVPGAVAVDGNRFKPWRDIPWTTVVKGDGKLADIAAASILAKTYRDDEMMRLHKEYPMYRWDINKGYPTKAHRQAIRDHGPSPWHRMSFRLLDDQLTLDL